MATGMQVKLIHILKGALGLDDDAYRDVLSRYGVASSKDLSERMAADLVEDLEEKAVGAGVWKKKAFRRVTGRRPHNINAGRNSRSAQLAKIEALLAVGNRPWAYADALAKNICKVDSIAFVEDCDLFRIISALRKQAKREGWDLSGEK